ncbi:MAG: SDR family NAD(P)-dependent oxidoreductase [Acidimicrobiales bacterium]
MSSRRIVITGSSRGIGLEMARILIGQGHEVYGAVRNPDGADALREAGPAGVLQLDIGDRDSIAAFADDLSSRTDAIDILVNNAGITSNDLGVNRRECNPWQVDPDIVLKETEINALGPMLITRSIIGLLEAGENPVVMNTSSQLGSMIIGAAMPFDVAYNVSKAAVNMITVMSASTNKDVCFVALHPGWVKTDMGTEAAELEVPEAANAIVDSLLGLTIADTGRFIRWDGTDHPW